MVHHSRLPSAAVILLNEGDWSVSFKHAVSDILDQWRCIPSAQVAYTLRSDPHNYLTVGALIRPMCHQCSLFYATGPSGEQKEKYRDNTSAPLCDVTQRSYWGKGASGALSSFFLHLKVSGRSGDDDLHMHPAQLQATDIYTSSCQWGHARVSYQGASILLLRLAVWRFGSWLGQIRPPKLTGGS